MYIPSAITEAAAGIWQFTIDSRIVHDGECADDGSKVYEAYRQPKADDIDESDAYLGYLWRPAGGTEVKYARALFVATGGDDLQYHSHTQEMTWQRPTAMPRLSMVN